MVTVALLDDYLFAQDCLERRLRETFPALDLKPVETLAQIDGAQLNRNTLFVLWFGDRLADASNDGARQMMVQTWLVVLGVRNERQADRDARNREAGPLLAQLHRCIVGWTPEGAHRPFKRANGPKPSYRANAGLYPLAFDLLLNL